MEFLRSSTRGAGLFFERLSDLSSRVGSGAQTDAPALPTPMVQACWRLGVPVSLVSGLMAQSTEGGFFLAARAADSARRPQNFPFQSHHLPIASAPQR